jgi:hypothetical protein
MMSQQLQTVGLASSSGYPVYSGLTHPAYKEGFQTRIYGQTVAAMITSSDMVPADVKAGRTDTFIWHTAPRGEVREYNKNEHLEHSRFNGSAHSMQVDKAHYTNFKLDLVDRDIPMLKKYIAATQEDSTEQLGAIYDRGVLQAMVAGAHSCNKGSRAGVRTHSYNLGLPSAPLELTHDSAINPVSLTHAAMAVLAEQNVHLTSMKGFAVWPTAAQSLFSQHPTLANACASGLGKSTLVTGDVVPVAGLKHYFAVNTPQYTGVVPGGAAFTYYPVIFGLRSATAFVQTMRINEVITQDPRAFAHYFRTLNVAGWQVVDGCYLAVAFVKIKNVF